MFLCVHGKLSQFDIEDMNLLNGANLDDVDHGHCALKLLSYIYGVKVLYLGFRVR